MAIENPKQALVATPVEQEASQLYGEQKVKQLKVKRDKLLREAADAAYEYFCECEVGEERVRAHEIYENIRTAGRVY